MHTAEQRLKAAVLADLTAERRECLFRLPRWAEQTLLGLLNDKRDLPVAVLLINILLTVVPAAVFTAYSDSHILGSLYCGTNFYVYLQRYLVALLHVSEHRPLFRKGAHFANLVPSLLLAPLYGVPSGMYKLHHRVMHHVEGNHAPLDSSSTERYTRDSWRDFGRYWACHTFGAWVSVPLYAWRKQRYGRLGECLAGELCYLAATVTALWARPVAALWILIVPFFLTSLAIMFGNWSQHIFVDMHEPHNVFRLAYNCVDSVDNRYTFNDGYHILHHLNSQTHWSELPQKLLDTIGQHTAEKALVFTGVGFFDVGLLVMSGALDRLAGHLLPCSPEMAGMSREETVGLLKSRLRPLHGV